MSASVNLSADGLVIPATDEGRAEYARAILRRGWCDHMWAFDNLTADEDVWLRAWCGLTSWDEVNTQGRCEHGFVVGECPNEGCPSQADVEVGA